MQASGNCSASYAITTLSAVSDRICMASKKPIQLSSQEIIDCDKSNYHCAGGYVNRVLNWGKRKGFVPEQCRPLVSKQEECPEDYLQTEDCRSNNNLYKVIDFCLASEELGIKKEILKNGPVVA
jgi:hypothetical protein